MTGAPAYVVSGGEILHEQRRVIGPVDFTLAEGETMAIVGHGGAGKSSLLKALGGAVPGAQLRGQWRWRGGPAPEAERWYFTEQRGLQKTPAASRRALLLEQLPRSVPIPGVDSGWRLLLDDLRAAAAETWLLDEPTVGAPAEIREEFERILAENRGQRTILLVTHDQSLARAVADRVGLCGDGAFEFHEAASLFASPATPRAVQYVRTGSSWASQPAPLPTLPTHFHWVIPEQLAGMGRPGLNREEDDDLAALSAADIRVLVSLTEAPFPAAQLQAFGIEGRHFPIRDMGIPQVTPTARLCKFIETRLRDGDRVAVHCHAGLGRTGLLLAAYLVWQRTPPEDAIVAVRRLNPRFIQTPEQERFLHRFKDDVG
jgi:atypical dual specificity phosphatase